jgi:hypothetical protein
MKTLFTPLFFFSVIALFSCNKDNEPSEGEPPLPDYARMDVTVSLCDLQNDPSCGGKTPIAGVSILLFESKKHRDEGSPVAFEGSTGAEGKAVFSTLEHHEYWVVVTTTGKVPKNEYVKTPARSTSFVEVVFYK